MADGAEFRFPWEQLEASLRDIGGAGTDKQLTKAMRKVGDAYEAEAVALAPHDKGYLENSSSVRTRRGSGSVRTVIVFGANYAAEVHEFPPDMRGPKTRAKPSTQFGDPGPKFLERVLRGMDFETETGRAFREVLKRASRRRRE